VRASRAVLTTALLVMLALLPVRAALAATAQSARTQAQISNLDNAALNWAESQAGKPYSFGAAGPYAYDCSGLVMAAFRHVGISLPHSTYAMLGDPHLIRVPLSDIRRGDILFYGSGHVEFATVFHDMSFGAHDSGTTVGWIRWWPGSWQPTMAFEVG
jgi:cell wall-associated NlpC family hydrolase